MQVRYALATAAAVAVVLAVIGSCFHPSPLAWPGFTAPLHLDPAVKMAAAPVASSPLQPAPPSSIRNGGEQWQ